MRPPRRFKQRRSQDTYESLLRAAATVFAKQGYDGTQTPDIAAEAGVSTGAFYRYFADKSEIFVEMIELHLARGRAEVAALIVPERFANADVGAGIDLVLDALFDRVKRDAALNRVYYAVSLTHPKVAAIRAAAELEQRVTLAKMVELFQDHYGALGVASGQPRFDPRAVALVVDIASIEVAAERAGLRPRAGPRIPDHEVRRAMREMVRRFLFPDSAPPPVLPPTPAEVRKNKADRA